MKTYEVNTPDGPVSVEAEEWDLCDGMLIFRVHDDPPKDYASRFLVAFAPGAWLTVQLK